MEEARKIKYIIGMLSIPNWHGHGIKEAHRGLNGTAD